MTVGSATQDVSVGGRGRARVDIRVCPADSVGAIQLEDRKERIYTLLAGCRELRLATLCSGSDILLTSIPHLEAALWRILKCSTILANSLARDMESKSKV